MNDIYIPVSACQDPNNLKKTLEDIQKAQASRVYLALGDVGRIPFERGPFRSRLMEQLKEASEFFLRAGIESAAWIGTLGFGIPTTHYNQAVAKDYTRIRSICDRVADDALCPSDPNFTAMTCGVLEDIARTGVRMIMLDDELCMSVRPGIGCACERHMAEYRQRIGQTVSRQQLGSLIFTGTPNRYRDAWLDCMGETLKAFCRSLRAAVDRVDPTIRLGFCAGYTSWDFEGADAIELTRILAGNTKPFLRLSGAPYWLTARRFGRQSLATYIEYARTQYAWCKNADTEIEVFTEADTYPRDRFHTPAAYSEAFHLATLASDRLPVLKYMYDYMCAPDFETGYVEAHVRNQALREQILQTFSDKQSVGIRVYETMRRLKNADLGNLFPQDEPPTHEAEKKLMQRYAFSSAQMMLTPHAIPTVYEGTGLCGIAFGENARALPKEAFRHGLILDIKAANILQERGIDVGLLCAEPIKGGFMERFEGASPDADLFQTTSVYRISVKNTAQILSYYQSNEFFSTEKSPAAYRYQNENGERFLVYAFDSEEQQDSSSLYWSYGRGKQIADAVEWLGSTPLPMRCERHPHLYAVCKENNGVTAIGFVNCCEDEIIGANVTFPRAVRPIQWIGCTGSQTDPTSLRIDSIKPFGFSGVEVQLV